MTYTQEMKDLDCLVAVRVFELPGIGFYKKLSRNSTQMEPCSPGDFTEDCPGWQAKLYWKHPTRGCLPIPQFCGSMDQAKLVIEHMKANGWFWTASSQPTGGYLVCFSDVSHFPWDFQRKTATGKTLEEAICRAAVIE